APSAAGDPSAPSPARGAAAAVECSPALAAQPAPELLAVTPAGVAPRTGSRALKGPAGYYVNYSRGPVHRSAGPFSRPRRAPAPGSVPRPGPANPDRGPAEPDPAFRVPASSLAPGAHHRLTSPARRTTCARSGG